MVDTEATFIHLRHKWRGFLLRMYKIMARKIFFVFLFFIFYTTPAYPEQPSAQEVSVINAIEPIKKTDRILILAPHPDDETIGCAGIIQQALSQGTEVRVVYLTNGDHNQAAFIVYEKRLTLRKGEFIHMGEVRRAEAIKAMKSLGLGEANLIFLGYPDFGTFTIFRNFWQMKKPFKSILTRISCVPYKQNLSYGAPYAGESILADLKTVLKRYRPNKIFVSHPADVNVDHKSFYLFLQVALNDLKDELPRPKIYPYLIHCGGWPIPRHYHPELSLEPPKQFSESQINWLEFTLTPEQLDKKHRATLCYKSQTESSAFYLLAFVRKNELFGDFPEIELAKQISLKERAVSFFGFSKMFIDSDIDMLEGWGNYMEHKGKVSYAIVDNSLLVRIEKTKELNRRFSVMLYLFGYSYKTPFAKMPKVRIITRYNSVKIFAGKSIIKSGGVSQESSANALILKVPLQALGDPEFILTYIKAYGKPLTVDTSGFRRIVIR